MKYTKERITQAKHYLTGYIKPGDTIYTKVNNVSRSGMSRNISIYAMSDGSPHDISSLVAVVTESSIAKDGGVRIGGCGMDMGFAIVNNLSYHMFPEYNCIGEKCPSNHHVNQSTKNEPEPIHKDGYALKQRWL